MAVTSGADETREGIRPGSRYWASLDGVRGVFMVTIFLYHADARLIKGAGISVDAFFVMSAFLITVLLVREHDRTGRIDLIGFYRRRVLRLFPAMLIVVPVAAVAAYGLIPSRRGDVLPAVVSVLFYYANFRATHHPTGMAVFLPTWSLSTEEQFYVAWSTLLLVVFALRVRPKVLLSLVGALCLAAAVWLQVAFSTGWTLPAGRALADATLSYRPDLRVFGILIGTFAGLLFAYDLVPASARSWIRGTTLLGTAFVVYYLFFPLTLPRSTILTTAIVLACLTFAMLVLQQVMWPVHAYSVVLEAKPVVWIGRASYVLYLVHVPVIRCELALFGDHGAVLRILLGGSVSLALGWLLHEYVEKPALRLKARRTPVIAD